MSETAVLVVDDDYAMRDSLREVLEDGGYTVLLAANGRDALDRLGETPAVGIVLLDMMMPVMNGLEFLAAKQRDGAISAIPVLLMTAHQLDQRSLPGVVTTLRKPFKMEWMLAQVKQLGVRAVQG